jgi:alkylation response protein AidB-like acyl-CoA dehydrogenase
MIIYFVLGFAALVSLVLMVKPLRRALISRWVMVFVKKQIPPISATEQAAIDAGDVWWEGELFRGMPNWKSFQSFPLATLTQEEQDFINHQTETLCSKIESWDARQSHSLQQAIWDYILQERFFSMLIPKEYGGLAFSALAQSTIVSKIASRDVSVAVTVMVPNSLGPSELLLHYGTPEQKNYYLPRLANGQEIPCFGLTGPEAGSDAGSMVDTGIVCYGEHQGQTVLGLKLNFSKRYITLAPVATIVGLAFKCFDPEGLLGKNKELGITLALVPASHPGMVIGSRNYPIGGCFPNGLVQGKDIFIPIDWIIGGAQQIGRGWHMLMECLAAGRGISLPAVATATCKLSTRATGAYAKVRKQFKVSIGEFEGVSQALARIGGFNYIVEAMRVVTASAINTGIKPSVVSAIAKYHMTEMARQSINDAMDIHGGRAVMMGPSNYLMSSYEMIPVAITVEGANILTRNLIIFGQGAIRCHPYLLQEINTAQSNDLIAFDEILFKHLRYTAKNGLRVLIQGLTGGKLITAIPSGEFACYYQQLSRMSTALALISDKTMMMLGGDLKRKENLSARLGDILSYLYMASCVLKYYEQTPRAEDEQYFVTWALDYCLYQMQRSWAMFFDNFPKPAIGFIFKKYVFPWGEAYRYPSDKLSLKLSQDLIKDSMIRDKLTQFTYLGQLEIVESAMRQEVEVLASLHKINKAAREKKLNGAITLHDRIESALLQTLITNEEYHALISYADTYARAIAVDDFQTSALV